MVGRWRQQGWRLFVKGFNKKIPVRLISYDDQSSPSLAGNLTNQLITRDKVDILLSDSTSVMTASAVPIARDNKQLLFDVTGSSPNFFTPDNKYIVLLGLAATDRYPKSIADFVSQMPKLGIKTVALLYTTADYTAFQATAVRKAVQANPDLKLVFDRGIPVNTTDYTLLVNNVGAAKPDALLEFGYPANEIAFLHAMQDNDSKFKFLFTGYGLTEMSLMRSNGLADVLTHSFALASPAVYEFKVNYGLDRTGVGRGRKPRPVGAAPCGLHAVWQAGDAGRAVHPGARRIAKRRDPAARADRSREHPWHHASQHHRQDAWV